MSAASIMEIAWARRNASLMNVPRALEFIAGKLKAIREQHGPQSIGALASPHQTLEELYLLQKLVRGLGSGNVDLTNTLS